MDQAPNTQPLSETMKATLVVFAGLTLVAIAILVLAVVCATSKSQVGRYQLLKLSTQGANAVLDTETGEIRYRLDNGTEMTH